MEKNVDIYEVARKAGVSKSTVSRVLNGFGASEKARLKVLKAVEELKYRPNISARYLRSNKNNLLGILIPPKLPYETIADNVNPLKLKGIVKKVKELDYDVLIFIEDTSDFERLRSIIMEKGLAGIILMNVVQPEVLENFHRYGIPYVSVNWFDPSNPDQCYVKTDLEKAALMGLELLYERGYREIGLINWEDRIIEDTFKSFMACRGLDYENSIWSTDIIVDEKDVYDYMERSRKRAYLCFSFHTSIKIIDYCRRRNLKVPDDVALISYEFFTFYDYLHPRLTGIRQKLDVMGELAVEKLVAIINGDTDVKSELIEPKLVIRDSC